MRQRLLLCLAIALLPVSVAQAEPLKIEDAMTKAYAHNPALMAERAKLRATEEKVSQALSGYRPSIDATAGSGISRQRVTGIGSDTLSPHDVGINVTQPVFRGFRTVSSVKAAEAEASAGRALLENAEQNLLFSAAQAYLDVVRSQRVLELTRGNEEVLKASLEATSGRFNVGEVTKTDVSQSESRLSAATAARIKAEGDLNNDRATFFRLVGEDPASLRQPRFPDNIAPRLEETVALAEAKNPAVIAARFAQEAAKADIGSAKGSLLPEVNLVGSVSRGWEQSVLVPDRQDDATIMARVTVPLYRSGTDYSKTRAARETATQRRLELEDVRNRMRELAVQAWQNLQTTRAAMVAHQNMITAAKLALLGTHEELKAGTRTTLDALNAEQELLEANVNLVRAERDEALALLQIRAVTGSLTARSLGLKVGDK